jgi:hypothetical protein
MLVLGERASGRIQHLVSSIQGCVPPAVPVSTLFQIDYPSRISAQNVPFHPERQSMGENVSLVHHISLDSLQYFWYYRLGFEDAIARKILDLINFVS